MMFKGSFTALLTPFRDGEVDDDAFQTFVEWQISEGSQGVVPCGTTGESPTLSHAEHRRVVELCMDVAKGRAPVVAGTGSNATEEAISLTKHAQEAGADGALVVTPYYNKPTQEGLYQHFKAIHDATDIPIIIYNIPGRSVVDMSVDTMARLAKLPNIVGVKESTGAVMRPLETRLAIGPDFALLSGEDAAVLNLLAHGGHGCISVTANIAPKACAALHDSWADGRHGDALAMHERLMPLHTALFIETSPSPAKYAASLLGHFCADVRLPLVEPRPETKDQISTAMRAAGVMP